MQHAMSYIIQRATQQTTYRRLRRKLAKKAYDIVSDVVQTGNVGDPQTQIFVQNNINDKLYTLDAHILQEQPLHITAHTCSYACLYTRLYTCLHTCKFACLYLCLHTCPHKHMSTHMSTHACTHVFRRVYAHLLQDSKDAKSGHAATVDELKQQLQKKSGIPPKEQRLVCKVCTQNSMLACCAASCPAWRAARCAAWCAVWYEAWYALWYATCHAV